MAEWTFDTDLDGWSDVLAVAWNAGNGYPFPGCVAFTHNAGVDDGGSISINPGYVVVTGDYISFYYRANLSANDCNVGYMIDCNVQATGNVTLQVNCTPIGDSGWQVARASIESLVGETVSTLQILTINLAMNATGVIYVDNVRLGTPLPDITSIAQFYSGLNALTYRSDLPFPGVNPGAMAILQNRTAVLGSNTPAGQIIVYGNPESYASWNNMTTPLTTGSAVTSIKNV